MPSWAPLTAEQLEQRRIVGVHAETVSDIASTDIPGHYGPAQDDTWSVPRFRSQLRVTFHQNRRYDAQFSLVGVDASIANAFRRILLAELPTLAIEDVYMFGNTSIIQDEVLSHRLGLIPLTGGVDGLRWMRWYKKAPAKDDFAAQATWDDAADDEEGASSVPSDYNTVVLSLDVTCRWADPETDGRDGKALAHAGETDPNVRYVNSNVYARNLVFESQGRQRDYFSGALAVRPANPDVLLAKLRPGQRIHCQAHCIKGIGADHAKFSPVATAAYRLLPRITLSAPILNADARKFARCFPRGVIGLVVDERSGDVRAEVADPMKDTVSRECLRHAEFAGKVQLGRVRDHFIFSVESTGQFASDELFLDSVRLLKAKCRRFKRNLAALHGGL